MFLFAFGKLNLLQNGILQVLELGITKCKGFYNMLCIDFFLQYARLIL